MNRGPGRNFHSIRWREAAGRDRFAARAGDLFRLNEPRQYSAAGRGCALHQISSCATGALPGLERSTWGADVLRRLWVSNYVDHAAALGIARAGQLARLLPAPL